MDASLSVDDYQRNLVLSFLSGKQNPFGDYSSSSGEIVGILKVTCSFAVGLLERVRGNEQCFRT